MADFGITEAIAIAAALASAAGTGVSLYANNQTQQAQQAASTRAANQSADNQLEANRAAEQYRSDQERYRLSAYQKVEEERQRQKDLQAQGDAQLQKSERDASIAAQLAKENQQKQALGKDYGQAANTSDAANTPGASTAAEAAGEAGTRVVQAGYKEALGKISALLGDQAKGQADLDARGNAGLLDSINQGRNAGNLGRITNFMHGSASVLPQEIAAANLARELEGRKASENMSLFGDNQARINAAAVNDINTAANGSSGANSVAALLGTTGNLAGLYAGYTLGGPPKAKGVTINGKPVSAGVTTSGGTPTIT